MIHCGGDSLKKSWNKGRKSNLSCQDGLTVMLITYLPLKCFSVGLVLTSVVANDVMSTTQDSSSLQAIITTEATDPVVTSSATSTTASITTKTSNTLETSRSMNAFDRNTNTTSTPGDRNSECHEHKPVNDFSFKSHLFFFKKNSLRVPNVFMIFRDSDQWWRCCQDYHPHEEAFTYANSHK